MPVPASDPHPPSSDSSHRRLDIQGLRGLAVLLVVAYHAGLPVPGGFIGVDVFFVISGFVITGLLLRQWRADGRIDFPAFYIRRIRRLLPALALVVCVTSAIAILIEPPNGEQQQTAQTAIGAMLLSANLVIPRLAGDYFARAATANPLLHTWSLSAEEQFYLAFPALLALGLAMARSRPDRRRGAAIVVAVVTTMSLLLLLASTYAPSVRALLGVVGDPFYSSPTRAWEFGIGALTSLAISRLRRLSSRLLRLAGLLGLVLVLVSAVLITSDTVFPGVAALIPVVGTSLVLASGVDRPHLLIRGLGSRLPVWMGDLSYSWYLWHWPGIVFGRLLFPGTGYIPLVSAAASLFVADLSYRFVENPIRFARRFGPWRLAALVTSGVGAPLLVAAVLGLGARAGWGQEWALGAHLVMQRDCDAQAFDPVRCTWSTPNSSGSVLLLGDSQAWALADGLIPAAASLGYETVVASNNACPFALPSGAGAAGPIASPLCVSRNESVIRYAREQRPRVVVIASQSLAYATTRVEQWRGNLSAAVKQLRGANAGVIIVSVVPIADEESMRTSLLFKPTGDRFTMAAPLREMRRDADTAEQQVALDNPGTVLLDSFKILCDWERCRVVQNGVEFYSDRNHLSRPGALLFEQAFREALKQAAKEQT